MRFISRYPLVPQGPKRLEIVRNRNWSEVITRLDHAELGRTDAQQLVQGVEYQLRDKSVLRVWLEYGPRGVPFLYVSRDGHPLPGSEGDPGKVIRETVSIIGVIATVQIAFALFVIHNGRGDAIINWMLGLGIVLLLLAFLGWRRSLTAMVLASGLCFAEIVTVFVTQAKWNVGSVWPLSLGLSIAGWLLWRGVVAVRTVRGTNE